MRTLWSAGASSLTQGRLVHVANSLADLDGDGKLEVIAASMDRNVYAWHADGSGVSGFPVVVVDPLYPGYPYGYGYGYRVAGGPKPECRLSSRGSYMHTTAIDTTRLAVT